MDCDVVVAGGGPVGLMLAAELSLHGAAVRVVERLSEVDTTIKAGSVNLPTIEALRRRGLLGELEAFQDEMFAKMAELHREPGQAPPDAAAMRQGMRKIGGHFGGLFKLDPTRLDPDDQDFTITDGHVIGVLPQALFEVALAAHAQRVGATLRRGVEVAGFEQDDAGVTVRLAGGEELRARYLVGCDGGRSRVRRLAGFDFPGTEPTVTIYQAMVTIDHPERLPKGWNRTDTGMLVHGPHPGRILTVEYDGPPADRDAPVTREELAASLRRVSGQDVSITAVESATRSTDNARQASTYRLGRVLLAGDAAHVHSPFGGQGLNLGIGDAVNLGWKLAAVVGGRHGDELLDTYTAERHPIAARVLEITRAQVALMRPDALTTDLRQVVAELMDTRDGNAYFVKMISGVVQRYDLGGGHEQVGRIMPLVALADGTTLADHCHDGGAVLFDLTGSGRLAELAAGRVRVVDSKPARECALTGLLVRPDGYVAWAGSDGTVDGLADALAKWC
jgi:2-polyprenyl-6-methoxyphenol hydroxylase-like FAD-dependent oxidoreductase